MNSKNIHRKNTPIGDFETEQFILEVQKQPCIWDVNSKSYNLKCVTNREIKKQAWDEIGRFFFPNWDEQTVEERKKKTEGLSRKWANIRKYYTDQVRKPAESPLKKRQRKYHHLLTFLDDTVNKKRVARIKEFQDIGTKKINTDNNSSDSDNYDLYIVEDSDELKNLALKQADPPVTSALLDNKNNPEAWLEMKRETPQDLNLLDKAASLKPQTENNTANMGIIYKNPEIMKLLNESRGPPPINNNFLYFPSARPVQDNILSQTLTFHQSEEASKRFLLSLLPEIMSLSVKQNLQFRLGIMNLLNDIKSQVKPDAIPRLFPNIDIN